MDGYMSSISPRITAVAVDLREEMVSLQAQLHVSLDGIHWVPDDYDPPRYPTQNSTEDEITAQKYDSQVRFVLFSAFGRCLYIDSLFITVVFE